MIPQNPRFGRNPILSKNDNRSPENDCLELAVVSSKRVRVGRQLDPENTGKQNTMPMRCTEFKRPRMLKLWQADKQHSNEASRPAPARRASCQHPQ